MFSMEYEGVNKVLNNLQKKITAENFFKISKPILKQEIQTFFDKENKPNGEKWLPSNRVKKFGGKTLNKKGILLKDVTNTSNYKLEGNIIKVYTTTKYGAIHNFGGKINFKAKSLTSKTGKQFNRKAFSVNMPNRQFIGLSNQGIQNIKIEFIKSI